MLFQARVEKFPYPHKTSEKTPSDHKILKLNNNWWAVHLKHILCPSCLGLYCCSSSLPGNYIFVACSPYTQHKCLNIVLYLTSKVSDQCLRIFESQLHSTSSNLLKHVRFRFVKENCIGVWFFAIWGRQTGKDQSSESEMIIWNCQPWY